MIHRHKKTGVILEGKYNGNKAYRIIRSSSGTLTVEYEMSRAAMGEIVWTTSSSFEGNRDMEKTLLQELVERAEL